MACDVKMRPNRKSEAVDDYNNVKKFNNFSSYLIPHLLFVGVTSGYYLRLFVHVYKQATMFNT